MRLLILSALAAALTGCAATLPPADPATADANPPYQICTEKGCGDTVKIIVVPKKS